ncbi:MAG TPA: glycosyltransferase family 9 protein [Thermoanaerobaculia bacterium]|nr:glycosyltransferase family 9 protein [Thermoanaerobaculia bacterium]
MRILIVRLSAMGDVLHALPLAPNARAAGASVAWIVERPFAGLLNGHPAIERVFVADTRAWRRAPLSAKTRLEVGVLRREVAAWRPDVVVDAQSNWKSSVLARILAGSRPVVGLAARRRIEPASAILCGTPVAPAPSVVHVVDERLSLLAPLGVRAAAPAPDATHLLAQPSPDAERFLASEKRPFVLLHPGAGQDEKCWGEERFAHLARGLIQARAITPVVSWGPGDERRAERLRSLLPKRAPMPALDFAGLARVIREAALFVAGDTGPLHLADSLGVRTVALHGPTDPARTGPYRFREGIVRDMRNVSDDTVLALALSLLARS